ncbi:unnamed protein product [Didymodactylos carnosus]|uniref:Uncharacterized protein n=1 Tax=Didymodactylos carnosus TaxID=1234261 RepID=A0A815U6B1_9BILA|nr:unnamed protein product [Didymodactylos carnosus]CAF1509779.1 unnamed protein product [Didymodactylos carnosus]CAF4191363.1 unnamed protein product [Didymodactylos carnosus]CAF4370671.1 unnamed protein product [Didymodactylos carnosus]
MRSFLSTSLNPETALSFIHTVSNDMEKVLFVVEADTRLQTAPFAPLSHMSYFPGENEVLFMLGAVFRIEKVDRDGDVWMVKLVLCTQDDEEMKQLMDHMKKDIGEGEATFYSLGHLLLYMGEYEKAETCIQRRFVELSQNDPEEARCYHLRGEIANAKGDYTLALEHHNRSLTLYLHTLAPDHTNIGYSYNSIGGVYAKMGDNESALQNYEKALSIWLKCYGENYESVAGIYNNMGNIYMNENKFDLAITNYTRSLEIKKKVLPANHPRVGQSYMNIGSVYYQKGEYDMALSNYEKSLRIMTNSLPPTHPSIANTYRGIGLVHEATNKNQLALEYFQKAATISSHSLLSTHQDVVTSEDDIRRIKAKLKYVE